MLDSTRRFRKFRASPEFYRLSAELGLHERHLGGRRPRQGPRRRASTLLERMAASGAAVNVWAHAPNGDRLRWVAKLSVHADHVCDLLGGFDSPGVRVVRPGPAVRQRVACTWSKFAACTSPERRARFAHLAESRVELNRHDLVNAWDLEQQRRRAGTAEPADDAWA
jgi:hypothetical protein